MPFRVSSTNIATSRLGKRISQLTGRHLPKAPEAAMLEIAPWIESSSQSSQSSGLSSPGAIMADEAALITGHHYSVFDDPWLPSFPRLPSQRRVSVPVSPKTKPSEGEAPGHAPQTADKVHSRSDSGKTVTATDIHGRPMSAITLPKGLTADMRSFLLMRRWLASHLIETEKQQSNLDTQNCDMIDDIMDLETRYRAMLSDQGKEPDMSPRDFYNKQKAIRKVFEELAKVRKQRVRVLAEKKRLDEQSENAARYLEGERNKLLEQLDETFESEGLLPAIGLMPPTPPSGSSQEVPVILDTSDDEDYDTTEEDHECDCEDHSQDGLSEIASDTEYSSPEELHVDLEEKVVAWRDRAIAKCPEAAEEMQHRAAKLAVSQMDEVLKSKYRHS